jgi:hypothetical protein
MSSVAAGRLAWAMLVADGARLERGCAAPVEMMLVLGSSYFQGPLLHYFDIGGRRQTQRWAGLHDSRQGLEPLLSTAFASHCPSPLARAVRTVKLDNWGHMAWPRRS